MTEQEPEDTCRPVEVDGEIVDVFGREEMTEEDRGHFAEIVRAAKRVAEADDRARFAEARQHGLKARHETRVERAASRLPEHVRGDGPCSNCGTRNNPIWFTESVFWNAVVRVEPRLTDDAEILCIPCFIIMADKRGYRCHWRLLPEWHWETKAEAAHRHELRELAVEETS